MMVGSGTMTHRLDKLEAASSSSAAPTRTTGTGVLVRLTLAGKRIVDAVVEARAVARGYETARGASASGRSVMNP